MLAEPVARNDGFRSPNLLGPFFVLGKFRDQFPDHGDVIGCSCTNGQHRKDLCTTAKSDKHQQRTG